MLSLDMITSGLKFEKYCGEILAYNGFINIEVTQASGDFGVDVLAEKDEITYAIQCKFYTSPIGPEAVQEIAAGKQYYGRDIGVVMTNSTFTSGAIKLAQANGVKLWDKHKLQTMAGDVTSQSSKRMSGDTDERYQRYDFFENVESYAPFEIPLNRLEHLLIIGGGKSGKTLLLNQILLGLEQAVDNIKFVICSPSVFELVLFPKSPSLLVPPVRDARRTAGALGWACTEIDKRYALFATEPELSLPSIYICVDAFPEAQDEVVDEYKKSIAYILKRGDKVGVHLIAATDDMTSGKEWESKFPTVARFEEGKRHIFQYAGPEIAQGRPVLLCVHPLMKDKITVRLESRPYAGAEPQQYTDTVMEAVERIAAGTDSTEDGFAGEDPMLPQAIEAVIDAGRASASLIQRRLKIGYARAARILDQMEARGIVGPYQGSKPRKVLVSKQREYALFNAESVLEKFKETENERAPWDDLPIPGEEQSQNGVSETTDSPKPKKKPWYKRFFG